ncbi:MAG: site-specific DNA-methyltransferase [Spirochaetales bacterium]|nr:site-specific DNA-methyltransferase [Spirochaetales bacterium]
MLLTCPINGIVLDPFTGTGTNNVVATLLGRKSIGIDRATEYLKIAKTRCKVQNK